MYRVIIVRKDSVLFDIRKMICSLRCKKRSIEWQQHQSLYNTGT